MGPGRARGPTEAPDPARGDRRPGEMGSLLNGAETGIRWKRGEELKLGCTFWGHGKQSVDGGGWGGAQRRWGASRRAPRRGKGGASWGRAGARGASTCRRAGRAAQVRKRGGRECGGQRGPRTGARGRRGPEGRRAPQGRRRHGSAGALSAGWHPGGRPGGGSPSPARRRRSCSSPWRGRRSPEAAPGAQLRPGAPRHASRRAPGEGAAWPRTTRRRRQRRRRWRELKRRRGSGQAPATSPGGGGGGGCAAPALLLLLQLLPSGKGRAATAAPPPGPRLPPPAPSPSPAPSPGLQPPPPRRRARLPSDSPPPVQRRAARTAGRRQSERGRALGRAPEPARRRAHFAVAPRPPSASGREGV